MPKALPKAKGISETVSPVLLRPSNPANPILPNPCRISPPIVSLSPVIGDNGSIPKLLLLPINASPKGDNASVIPPCLGFTNATFSLLVKGRRLVSLGTGLAIRVRRVIKSASSKET